METPAISPGSTAILAEFCATLRYEAIHASAISMAKCLLLDGLACLVVGTQGSVGRSAATTVGRLGGHPHCTIFTGNGRGSVRDAAFANAVALYSVGLNDIHKPSTSHPGGCILAPVLAMAECQAQSGRDILTAMVAGYDVNARLGIATAPTHRQRGFHTTGTIGTFGATAAVGRMAGLTGTELASAFGIAGSQAAGLYEFHHDGTLTMIFHAGRAAQNGVEAVMLVQDGFSGPATVLEGAEGFCRATTDRFDIAALTDGLGDRFLIEETSFRPYYGCSSTIAPSGAVADIIRRLGPDTDRISALEVQCHPVVAKDNCNPSPTTLLGARLSMEYNLALVMERGDVFTGDLAEADLWNPAIRDRMSTVHLVADATMPRFGAAVTALLDDGRREQQVILVPRGDASAPLTFDDVSQKFRRMAGPISQPDQVDRLISLVERLEATDGPALVAAISALTGN